MKIKKTPFFFIITLLYSFFFSITISGVDFKKYQEAFLVNNWDISDGLPQNSVFSIVQTSDGYIWLGTGSGLVRFDGIDFKVFNHRNTKGIKSDWITSIIEDKEEKLWIGTNDRGLSIFDGRKWESITIDNGLSDNHIRVIYEDSSGSIWVGTDYGLNCFSDKKVKTYTTLEGLSDNSVNTIIEDRAKNLWVGTDNGLSLIVNNRCKVIKMDKTVNSIELGPLGNLVVGTNEGLYIVKNKNLQSYREKENIRIHFIGTLKTDRKGSLWIGTDGSGLFRMKDGRINQVKLSKKFSNDYLYAFLEDREDNIWIGTNSNGLIRLKKRNIINVLAESIPGGIVNCVIRDRNDNLLAGTKNGIFKLNGNDGTISKLTAMHSGDIRTIFEDRDGCLWAGTEKSGLYRINNDNVSRYTKKDGLLSDRINLVFQDNKKRTWIGTDKGLNLLKDSDLKEFITIKDFFNQFIRVIYEDTEGVLWIGTKTGLFYLPDGKVKQFGPGNQIFDENIFSIYRDKDNSLWIGTRDGGLYLWRKERLTVFFENIGLTDNHIFSINEDKNNHLWFSSYSGIFKISKRELILFSENRQSSVNSIVFDESDGMASRECVGGRWPSSWKTKEGIILYPTIKGIAVIDPGKISTKNPPPLVIIENVLVDSISYTKAKNPVFSKDKRVFEFYFTGINFSAPGKLKFRYRLEGFEKEWHYVKPGQRRYSLYINLYPGQYRFVLYGAGMDNIWNTKGEYYSFEIDTGVRIGLYLLGAVILMLLTFTGWYYFYIKKRGKEAKEKYKTSGLTPEMAEKTLEKLLEIMEKEKPYLDPDLTLKKLSEKLFVHYNHLSQVINEKLNQTSTDFINKYRIGEAKKRLSDIENKEKTILEIAYDCGFYSKSVFNTAFKKITGKTPSQFRNKSF